MDCTCASCGPARSEAAPDRSMHGVAHPCCYARSGLDPRVLDHAASVTSVVSATGKRFSKLTAIDFGKVQQDLLIVFRSF